VFVMSTRRVKALGARIATWPPARPLIGGALVLAMMVAFGTREYLGLSLPLAESALGGNDTSATIFALKMLFTVITLGFGFYGGEVTPLLVIGAVLGAALAPLLGLPIALVAAVGYVAVFAGAASVPFACTIMAAELFGIQALVPAAIACSAAYVFSSHRSIYASSS
jgi:H+/Cl- antiporter ClcA